MFGGTLGLTFFGSTVALATTPLPTCSASQLTMTANLGHGAYNAAGNEGIAFIFVNVGERACTLRGYPHFRFTPSSYKGRRTTISHNGSAIFAPVTPRLIVLRPGGAASFGLNYGDAYNQGDPYAGPCQSKIAAASLPVQPRPYSTPLSTPLSVNFCFANFQFGVTSLQSGRRPKTLFGNT